MRLMTLAEGPARLSQIEQRPGCASAYAKDSGLLGGRITPGGYQRFAYLCEL